MKTLSKFVCASVAAVALLVPGVIPASPVITGGTAAAHHDHHYYVYYRECPHSPWFCYGVYHCPVEAQNTAFWIQSQGYQVFYR